MGLNVSTGELFALKEIEIRSDADSNQLKQLQKLEEEIFLMKNLRHKHIVSYKGSYRTDTYFYIFMEYVPGGSIARYRKSLIGNTAKDLHLYL
jgi:mitogen-activated protein kinase kinase kinase